MTAQLGELTSLLLAEVFGDVVANVGLLLHDWNSQNLEQLLSANKPKTREALTVLINHNLVTFKESERNGRVEYVLNHDKVLALIRYPRYLLLCRTLFGTEGEILIEEIFKRGRVSAFSAICSAIKKIKASTANENSGDDLVQKVRTAFINMAKCQFICRIPSPYTMENPSPSLAKIPKLVLQKDQIFHVPALDIRALNQAVAADTADDGKEGNMAGGGSGIHDSDDKNILWCINNDRFNREFRDQVLVQAVSRRIDSSAGNLMRVILNIMNESKPWVPVSNDIHQTEIFQRIVRAELSSAVGSDGKLQSFHDQYLKVLEEDRMRFLDRVGDAGGGQFVVQVKHVFKELAAATVDNIVLEKYGSKALRIFRVIRDKLHVEESQLQSLVMIPSKETKELTYQLLENNFIQLQELRKSMAANAISKSFYLFYVDMNQVSRMIVELCHKSLTNSLQRKNHEAELNQRLLDKQERIESIAATIKNAEDFDQSEELQQQLQEVQDLLSPAERETVTNVKAHLDQLIRAGSQVDETLFIMNTYLFYEQLTS